MSRRYYLGKYGSEASREAYSRFIAELVAKRGALQVLPSNRPGDAPTVVEIAAADWQFAEGYYRGGFLANIQSVIGVIRDLYGRVPAPEFGPRALQAVQAHLVTEGHSRSHVNKSAAIIKRMFRWVGAQELINTAVYQALGTVAGLRKERTEARESEPVGPVPSPPDRPGAERYRR